MKKIEDELIDLTNSCVQCIEPLTYTVNLGKDQIPICYNPGCPNFGLLQCGTNFIPEMEYAMSPDKVKKYQKDVKKHNLRRSN